MSRALLFDIGNVLVHFDFEATLRRFAKMSDNTSEEINTHLAPFKNEHESGRISDNDFITQSIARIGFHGTHMEFAEIWSDIFTENVPMTALVEKLAGQCPLYLFSNTSGLHKDWLFQKFPVFARFDGGIYSYEAGCAKPHEQIYREAIARFRLDPANTFYIDDLHDNIQTGRRLGFVAHHYEAGKHTALGAEVGSWLSDA